MIHRSSFVDSRCAAITFGIFALILYGSLYPFDFHRTDVPPNLLTAFAATRHNPLNRGDVISNILLYLPLGFFGVRCFPGRSPMFRVLLTAAAASLTAFAIEFAQYYDAGRGPNVADGLANSAGALFGGIAGVAIGGFSAPVFLLCAWFGARLLPYFPSIRLHKYEAACASLFTSPIDPLDVFRYFALWLAAAALLESVAGVDRSRRALAIAICGVLASRIVIIGTDLAPAEVLGAALAATLWIAVLWRTGSRRRIVCVIFATFVVVDALRPFHFAATPRAFGWVPFLSFIEGHRESGSRVFLEKTFIYGSLLWLLHRAGASSRPAAVSAVTLVSVSRFAQIYLPGRSAEITDSLMVLMLAAVLAWLGD